MDATDYKNECNDNGQPCHGRQNIRGMVTIHGMVPTLQQSIAFERAIPQVSGGGASILLS